MTELKIWHVIYQSSQESESIKFPQVKIQFDIHILGFTCHIYGQCLTNTILKYRVSKKKCIIGTFSNNSVK